MDELLRDQCLAFMKFVDDCTAYCIANRGQRYELLPLPGEYTNYFTADYGEAVLHHHGAHEGQYMDRITKFPASEILTHKGLQSYMTVGMVDCFQNHTIMEGILMFCSLYVDTAFFCYRHHSEKLINNSMVCCVSLVFEDYVKALFEVADPAYFAQLWDEIKTAGINLVEMEVARTLYNIT